MCIGDSPQLFGRLAFEDRELANSSTCSVELVCSNFARALLRAVRVRAFSFPAIVFRWQRIDREHWNA